MVITKAVNVILGITKSIFPDKRIFNVVRYED